MNVMSSDTLLDHLLRVKQGDRAAFGRLYDLAAPQLFALALMICRRRSVAEEVLQEAFLRIWRSAHQFEPERGRPMAWMATILRRLAIDSVRRGARERPIEPGQADAIPDLGEDPFAAMVQTQESRALWRCLEELEGDQRRCVLLAYFGGLSHGEVAQRTGLPLGTVKSHIRRGVLRLKGCLDR